MNLVKYLLILLLPLFGACAYVSPIETDVTKDFLSGDVKFLKENSYEAFEMMGKIQKGESAHKSWFGFDYTKTYNKEGLLEEYCEFDSKTSKLVYKNVTSYDHENYVVSKSSYSGDNILDQKSVYTYDDLGHVVEVNAFNANDQVNNRHTYEYDGEGRTVLECSYFADSTYEWKRSYRYNDRGQVVMMHRDDADSRFDCTYVYKYNDNHQLEEEIVKDADRIFNKRYVYSYDKRGNRTMEESYNSRAKLYSRIAYMYNKKGDKISMNELYLGHEKNDGYSYTYVYDKEGNWTRRVEYYNDTPKFLVVREIEYHND